MSLHALPDLKATRQWIKSFSNELQRPCVVLLEGDLGSGKTQFVRWFLEELGVSETTSPTFAIHNAYTSPSGRIDHVDLYRIESDGDLEATGFWDLLSEASGLVFVEWADRLPEDVWPKTWRRVRIHLRKSSSAMAPEAREMELEIKTPLRVSR